EAPAAADNGLVTERVRNADTRSEILVLGLHEVVIQTPSADRFRVRPTDVKAGIRVRAVALPDKVAPIGLRSSVYGPDGRKAHSEIVAQRICEGWREFVPQTQRQGHFGSQFPCVVNERMLDVALESRIGDGNRDRGLIEVPQHEFGEGVAAGSRGA